MSDRNNPLRGFTLIELMVTLAVTIIITIMAAPSFSAMIVRSRMATATNDLVSTLIFARSMAVTTKAPVTICPNNSGACGTASDWAKGALVFTDANKNKTIDGTDAIRKRVDASENITMTANVAAITYNLDGTATIPTATSNSKWLFCDPTGRVKPRIVAVSGIGANYLYKPADCSL